MKITLLGTGHALVTKCYNTCFVLSEGERHFLVDGGGGSAILGQLEKARIPWRNIHEMFLTHKHIDHLLGMVWMVRLLCDHMNHGGYEGEAVVYGHEEALGMLRDICEMLLQKKETRFLNQRLHLVPVADGEVRTVLGRPTTFFDIGSTKAKQFGFSMELKDGRTLTCCGDEPCSARGKAFARGAAWLLHEAFCLASQAGRYHPYEKHHSTAQDAARLAQELGVENLLLYHTEDDNIANRKKLYIKEAQSCFKGRVYVPDDLESYEL